MLGSIEKRLNKHLLHLKGVMDNCDNATPEIVERVGQEILDTIKSQASRDHFEVSQCLIAAICNASQVKLSNGKIYFNRTDDFGNAYWELIYLHRPITG